MEKSAKIIERKTGYKKFRLVESQSNDKENYLSDENRRALTRLISTHAVPLLEKMKSVLETKKDMDKIEKGIEVWTENYKASRSGLVLSFSDDMKIFIELLKVIGIRESQINLSSNSLDNILEIVKSSKLKMPDENFIKRSNSYRSIKLTPLGKSSSVTILFEYGHSKSKGTDRQIKGGHTLSSNKLHHLLFLTAVLMKTKSNPYQQGLVR